MRMVPEVHEAANQVREKLSELKMRMQEQASARPEKLRQTYLQKQMEKLKVDVTLQDGRTFEGTVVNGDLYYDIAIVKIKSKTPLSTAKLGSSSKLRSGNWVIAMGCPLTLQNTITAGIVSCVDHKSSDLGLGGMHKDYLQTDCATNVVLSFSQLVCIN
ncbi:hypothetical protein REPUB_Repub03eG0052000 [Reevesia pubescens]